MGTVQNEWLRQCRNGPNIPLLRRALGPLLAVGLAGCSASGGTLGPPVAPPPTTSSATLVADPADTTNPADPADTADTADPVLIAAGDLAACHDDNRAAETAALVGSHVDAIATLGDHVYEDGTAKQFADCYEPTWGGLRARTRPAPGNHDYNSTNATPYYSYFGDAAGDPRQGWYSYELGAWHIVVLNSECDEIGGCGRDSAQVQWFRDDLAAHPTVCLAAYWHKPRFSSGTHGSSDTFQPFWEVLAEHGADVILNGHDHDYERFAPQSPAGEPDPRGARQFVVGTGGKDLRGFVSEEPNREVGDSDTYGVLELTLHADSYDWQFLPIAGGLFTDGGSATCSPPPTPTG